jgi:hypothetical protein
MGMNKQTSMAYLAAVLLGGGMLTSCSDSSIEVEEPTVRENSNIYANISLVVQDNGASGTRDGDETSKTSSLEGEPEVQGEASEATVKQLILFAFEEKDDASGLLKDTALVTSDISDKGYDKDEHVTYNTSVVFRQLEMPEGTGTKTYRLYAIANPNGYKLSENEIGKTSESNFLEKQELLHSTYPNGWIKYDENNPAYLPMANRAFKGKSSTDTSDPVPYVTMTVNSDNSSTNPATATIELERLVAKYEVAVNTSTTEKSRSVDLKQDNAQTAYATVEIDGYAPFNLNSSSYAIRHRSTLSSGSWGDFGYYNLDNMSTETKTQEASDGSAATTSNWGSNGWIKADYVVDPYTKKKGVPTNVSYNDASGLIKDTWAHSSTREFTDIENSDSHIIGYSFENITEAKAQYMENSTGLIFRAKLTPGTGNVYKYDETSNATNATAISSTDTYPDSIYYYNYKFYIDAKALYQDNKATLPSLSDIPTEPTEPTKESETADDDNNVTAVKYTYTYGGSTTTYEYSSSNTESSAYTSADDAKAAAYAAYQKDYNTYNQAILENNKLLSDYGVTVYHATGIKNESSNNDGTYYCYYPYIFKHYALTGDGFTEAQKTMTPMKFAVVRNNWYQVTVTNVLTIGRGTPEPDQYVPTPDENTEIWLKVNLKVRDWILRKDTGVTLK